MKKENRELITFFAVTFALSWLLWLPGVLRSNGAALPEWVGLFGMFAPLMPSVVAFVLTGRSDGRSGVAELARRGIRFDFNPVWLLPVFLIPAVIGLLTRYILQATGNEVLAGWEAPTLVSGIVTFFVILFIGGGLEEFGWRGYALGRLQKTQSALAAGLVLGLLWGLWHLPLHFIEGTTQANIPIWQFVLRVTVSSVLFTWLFNNTNRSVLVAILYHTAGNTASALLPPFFATEFGRWTNFTILLVITAAVVLVYGPKKLRRS